ncbi:MAG: glycine betaine/L-proline ABC transporter ATP-binding protein ProV [Desulfurivibrionaceae bacterium]|nr:glycine betaine/L-proline ABC transporter ATP-binding protein ProV [Desulfurivibrionaceae bacterium]
MADKIVVKNLYKIFGNAPQEAMRLLEQGVKKEEIFQESGQAVGVCDASFAVQEGEIFVIMGLSGSGKSTLVRLLNRLIEPTAGQIIYEGIDIASLSARELLELRRSDLSMVFQSFALMSHLNVLDNTAFGMELSHVPRRERLARARVALAQVGLEDHAASFPDELSGGMQQRVGLARALANDPSVMLMDEAFSALDPLIRTEMQDELLHLQKEKKRTIIFISHDLDEAMRIGDRIAIMEGGQIVQVGTPKEILHDPADDYVRSFFRGVNVSSVLAAADVARKERVVVFQEGTGLDSALTRLQEEGESHGYVVGPDQELCGVISQHSLRDAGQRLAGQLADAFVPGLETLPADLPLAALITKVAHAPCDLPVVSAQGRFLGVISKTALLETMDRTDV